MKLTRFISTCVETAISRKPPNRERKVHLHVCGDSSQMLAERRLRAGSSPRVWRQLAICPHIPRRNRFISTCVETAL